MTRYAILISAMVLTQWAQANDLVLPGEKWLAKFDKFVCSTTSGSIKRPDVLEQYQVGFEQITTDATLDNGLVKVAFKENGQTCRYSAILFADNAAFTIRLVESHVYAVGSTLSSYCEGGRQMLDKALARNDYLYYGHPHNLAIMMPGLGSEEVCSGGKVIGANFVVKGLVKRQ